MRLHSNFNTTKRIALVSVLLLFAGCKSLGPDYQRPAMAMPTQFSEEAADNKITSSIANTWWTLYQDKTLNDLVAMAQQNNTDIKLAVARIEEADAAMREVGAETFPTLNLDTRAARSRVTGAGAFPVFGNNPRNNYIAQLGTSFEIDFWGKLRRAKESARAQTLSSIYAKDTVALSLSGLVANNYLLLRSLDSQIVISQENLKSRDDSLALTKRRLEGGVVSALDVYQAEVASANLRAQLAEFIKLRAITLHQLAVLTGTLDLKLMAAEIESLPIPPTPPAGLPSSLLEARPDVRQAEQQLVSANANIGVAKAALYPTISLTAALGGESLELSNILKSAARIWTGGLSLHLPIFDSGKTGAQVEQASAQQKQALASYESAIQNAFREVNDALVNVRQSTEREFALNESRVAAKKALEISKNRYQSGYSAYLEVLDSQRAYNEAALAFVQSRQSRLFATVELFKALGGGWHSDL